MNETTVTGMHADLRALVGSGPALPSIRRVPIEETRRNCKAMDADCARLRRVV